MRKLTFSVGLILLIAFSIFSPLQILKIESANAQVTVPKTYVQTVNDPYIDHTDAWDNFTVGLDPDSLALINNGSDSSFTAYCKRVGTDAWGDCIARQGYLSHGPGYCRDWDNKIIKPMVSYPYIPADVGNDQIILQATAKHSAPIWYGNLAPPWLAPQGPTIGATIMLFFNVYVHDNENGGEKWLFNYHEPDPWGGPDVFLLEIFITRWVVWFPPFTTIFASVPPGNGFFEGFATRTTHDQDLHLFTLPFEMPENDQWYYFLYDLETKIHESATAIEHWSIGRQQTPVYTVLGFQLMEIAMGVETIGGSWTFQFGDISLTDMRWGSGSAYQNSAACELKTRVDGVQSIPRLNEVIGYPNPLRPYMTYTQSALDSDINDDGYVNAKDSIRLGTKFGSRESDADGSPSYPRWDYTCDITKDGFVNAMDATRLGAMFGQTGTYQTGLGTIEVWMQESGPYLPDPYPGYTGPPWLWPRTVPYTAHYYMELWDVIDWPSHISASINYMVNYMGEAIFYNATTLNQTGICLYAYDYPIHD
ncbi:MAG: hypothetical protein MUO31_02380 [Thermodesulfovibrionales bacterium]|nr:hypothetical protein [Thermodesulfovibrionales bacterium]